MAKLPYTIIVERTGNSLCIILNKKLREAWKLHFKDVLIGTFDEADNSFRLELPNTGPIPIKFPAKLITDEKVPIKRRMLEYLKAKSPKHISKARLKKALYPGENRKSNEEKLNSAIEFLCMHSLAGSDGDYIWYLSEGLAQDLDYEEPFDEAALLAEVDTINEKKS